MTIQYSGKDSWFRIRSLQDLCGPESNFDAVLLVGGADGNQNRGSQAALKYLFLGKSGQDLLGDQVIEQKMEILEDCVILLTYSSVAIYYHSDAKSIVLPIISTWRNVTEYPLPDKFANDSEKAEGFKIFSFIAMTQQIEKVALPLGGPDQMLAEKWPIVQAYGLDGAAQQGFFTMNHTVFDCSKDLSKKMSTLDEFAVKKIVHFGEPLLRKHWDAMLTNYSYTEDINERMVQSEEDIADEIISFYDFGTVQHESLGLEEQPERGARLLFGKRSNKFNDAKSSSATAKDSGVGPHPATHFVIEGEDPATGLRVGRTYFLSSGKVVERVLDPEAIVHDSHVALEKYDKEADNLVDTEILNGVYCVLYKALQNSVSQHQKASFETSDLSTIKKAAVKGAVDAIRKNSDLLNSGSNGIDAQFIEKNLSLDVEYMDSCGELIQQYSDCGWNLIYIRLAVNNIPSKAVKGETLGSVLVGDSYLCNGESLNRITGKMAEYRCWTQAGKEAAYVDELDKVLASEYMLEGPLRLGKEVGEQVSHLAAVFDSDILPAVTGTLRGYKDGFVFKSSFNPLIVSFRKNTKRISIVPTKHRDLLLLTVEFHEDDLSWISKYFPVKTESARIGITFHSDNALMFEILASWKESAIRNDIPFHKPVDSENDTVTNQLQSAFEKGCCIATGGYENFKESLFTQWTLPQLTTLSSTWNKKSKGPIPVTSLIGIPGSGVHSFAHALSSHSADSNQWSIINIDNRMTDKKNHDFVVEQVKLKVAAAVKDIQASALNRRPRILLSVTGFVDPITVVMALKQIAEIKISTITAILSASNVYASEKGVATYPKVLDQCSVAFVDNIVVSNCNDSRKEQLNNLRLRLDRCNPNAEKLFLSSNIFESHSDSLLAVDSFERGDKKILRGLLYPSWDTAPEKYISPVPSEISSIRFKTTNVVNRTRFLAYVKELLPHSKLRVISAPSNKLPKEGQEGKGILRLAQSMAKTKVEDAVTEQVSKEEASKIGNPGICGACWSVSAKLQFSKEDGQKFKYTAAGTRASLRPQDSDESTHSEIIFTGSNLNAAALKDFVLACSDDHYHHHARKIRVRESVTMEERRALQKQHVNDPLPEGYFFDGVSYVDFIGNRLQFHPLMDKFIESYLGSKATDDSSEDNGDTSSPSVVQF